MTFWAYMAPPTLMSVAIFLIGWFSRNSATLCSERSSKLRANSAGRRSNSCKDSADKFGQRKNARWIPIISTFGQEFIAARQLEPSLLPLEVILSVDCAVAYGFLLTARIA
jgi:hypothetical protein